MQTDANILYIVNNDDVIVFTNDAWDSFAIKNDAPGIISANVLNRSLWDFIIDETTRSLYRHILMLVRNGKFLQFNYSCDSPDKLRFMEMTVTAGKDGEVQFQSKILQSKDRVPQRVLDRNAMRTDDLIRICSWCKSIDRYGQRGMEIFRRSNFDLRFI